jgi:putative heme-binding domain-containing protein
LAAAFRIAELEPEITAVTIEQDQTPERQALGIKALSEIGTSRVDLFQRLAISGKSDMLHQEAVAALASSKNDRAFPLLVEIWPVLTPKLRKVSIDRLTTSPKNSRGLLEAIQRDEISTEDLDAYAIDKLKAVLGDGPDLAAIARDMAARQPAASPTADLKKKFDTIREYASRPGNVDQGKALFTTTCLVCHTVHGEGRNLGPTLNGAGAMDPESLLRSIVTPGAAIESGYYRYRVETKDGEITDGLFVSQNENEIILRPATGEDVYLPRSTVRKAGFTKTSMMPDGLVDALSPQDVANLFAYLRTLK